MNICNFDEVIVSNVCVKYMIGEVELCYVDQNFCDYVVEFFDYVYYMYYDDFMVDFLVLCGLFDFLGVWMDEDVVVKVMGWMYLMCMC